MKRPSPHETIKAKLPSTLPIEVKPVLRSSACSHTPEEADSLSWKEMARLYAPVGYLWVVMIDWIQSRSWADCHKWINEHDDELVREVLKDENSVLLLAVASYSQVYSESLVFLALQMIHRHPPSVGFIHAEWPAGASLAGFASNNNACSDLDKVTQDLGNNKKCNFL